MKNKRVKFKWFVHRNYLVIVIIAFLLTSLAAGFLYVRGVDWRISLPVIGGLVSFMYFIQKHQLDEARLFKDLFVEFNRRYDDLNGKLNDILRENTDSMILSPPEKNTIYDYFNLCAEEYLFFRKGYIYPEVWDDWLNGMKIYFRDPRIRKLWSKEAETESYYGLDLREELKEVFQTGEA
jgi:hypothetical protein